MARGPTARAEVELSGQVCKHCGSVTLRWTTLRRQVPVDVLQCDSCGRPNLEEDWQTPLAPISPGACINCGYRRQLDICQNCGLSRVDDEQVHDELRQMIAPTHDFLNAARQASKIGRRLIALKLATAALHLGDQGDADRARALRVWLLSAIGEPKAALDDARAWVEASADPSALAWASVGQQQLHSGFTGAAAESFHRALQKDGTQGMIRAQRARLLLDMAREGQAAEDACIVLESSTEDRAIEMALEVAAQLCDKFEATMRDDEVRRLLERAGAHVDRSPVLLGHRARLAAHDGDVVAAKRDLKKAKKIEPKLPVYDRVERLIKPQRTSWWRW